jgi:hypothetical protein
MASMASQLIQKSLHMRKETVSRMRERYAQTVLPFRITYVKDTSQFFERAISNFRDSPRRMFKCRGELRSSVSGRHNVFPSSVRFLVEWRPVKGCGGKAAGTSSSSFTCGATMSPIIRPLPTEFEQTSEHSTHQTTQETSWNYFQNVTSVMLASLG